MERRIRFVVSDNSQMTTRIINYFEQFNLKLIEHTESCLKFGHRSTIFDAWKTNPLTWGSKVSVSISENTILADFYIDTDAQMNTKEEETVWLSFIESFQNYLTNGATPDSKLSSAIINNKKSRISYIGWAGLGALTGGLASFTYNKLIDTNSTFSIFLIPVLATAFLTWRIRYAKAKTLL